MRINPSAAAAALVVAMLAGPASAAETGAIAAYVSKVTVDDEVLGDDDGTGFGARGWFGFGGPFAHFEYQAVTLDDSDLDVNELRIGGGMSGEMNRQVHLFGKAEYIDLGSDLDLDGFGVHGGVKFIASPQFNLTGSVGYLTLSGDLDDASGLEVDLTAAFKFNQQFGGFFGYRTWMGSLDDAGTDLDVSSLRVGGVIYFGR